MNALDIQKKDKKKIKIVVNGAGASAMACTNLLLKSGVKKSNIIIADNSSGLDDSSIILKAKKVIIDSNGPRKTTINVARLENKNLSKILLTKSLFLTVFTICLLICCKFTSFFYHV